MNTQLHNFIGLNQLTTLEMNMQGEEKNYFEKLIEELENTGQTHEAEVKFNKTNIQYPTRNVQG